MAQWTAPSPAVAEVVTDLQAAIQRVLGKDLAALYLSGSLVVGDFDSALSDIDLCAVTREALSEAQIAALGRMHDRFEASHPEWQDRIEVAYFWQRDLDNFRTTSAHFPRISPGEPFHMRRDALVDWAEDWYLLRDNSVALIGPSAVALIPEVAIGEFLAAALGYLRTLVGRLEMTPGKEFYTILTACRALHMLEIRSQTSKVGAGLWMAGAHQEWSALIDQALIWRYVPRESTRRILPSTVSLLEFVAQRLSAAQAS